MYDTLTAPDVNGDFVPFLAESVEPNGDYTQWTIKLRDGIKFHDGTDLTAQVVKNNLDAYRGEYPARQALLLPFLLEPISNVDTVDDSTVVVTTDIPWPSLPNALHGGGRVGIMAQSQLDDPDTCDARLVGTGPFKFEEWAVNDHLTVTRNPDYWQHDDDGNALPYLDRIEFRPIIDPTARVNALLTGDINAMHDYTATGTEQLDEAAAAGEIAVEQSALFPEVSYTLLNASAPPFDNLDARLAVAYATDREEFNQIRNLGLFDTASGPFGPGSLGYLEDSGYPEFDLEKAQEHAEKYESETGSPLKFTYTHPSDLESTQSAQLLQSQWAEAGIDVSIVAIEQAALISQVISGNYEAIAWRFHAGGDPDDNFVAWHSGTPLNFGRLADPELDAILEEGRSEPDRSRRDEIYQDVNRTFAVEAYSQWLNWVQWSIGTATDVHGVLGPNLPNGEEPFPGLATGHPLSGMWIAG